MTDHNISWHKYFMELAKLTALRSKDPNTKVGAIIVSPTNKIRGLGYNGFVNTPGKDNDKLFPWDRGEGPNDIHSKYMYVVHAEANAILNAHITRGCTLYCTLAPCNECAQLIVQAGIKKVIYLEDPYHDEPPWIAARYILSMGKVINLPYSGVEKSLH